MGTAIIYKLLIFSLLITKRACLFCLTDNLSSQANEWESAFLNLYGHYNLHSPYLNLWKSGFVEKDNFYLPRTIGKDQINHFMIG